MRPILSTDARCSILDPRSTRPRTNRWFDGTYSRKCLRQVQALRRVAVMPYSRYPFLESAGRFNVVTIVSTPTTSKITLCGEELPRGSLNPGDSYLMVGIMVGIIGRSILNGGRKSAHTRWACRQPLWPSGLSRSETSRDSRLITTWRFIHTQFTCQNFATFCGLQGVQMTLYGIAMSA